MKYSKVGQPRPRPRCQIYRYSFETCTLVNKINKRFSASKTNYGRTVVAAEIKEQQAPPRPIVGEVLLNEPQRKASEENAPLTVNSTHVKQKVASSEVNTITRISLQDRKMIVKEIENIAFDPKDKKTDRIQQLRYYKEALMKTYHPTTLATALKMEFDNRYSEKYNCMGLINGGMLIYIAYFPEMMFWKKLFHLGTTHVEKPGFDSITAIMKVYLQDLGLSFTLSEVGLFKKYFAKNMSDKEFIAFFQYCITNEMKTLKLNNTMFFIKRIFDIEKPNDRTKIYKSILTFEGAEEEFKNISLHQKLSKLLPDKYFFSAVEYMVNNNVDNKYSTAMLYLIDALSDFFLKKSHHKNNIRLVDISNYLRCFYLVSLQREIVETSSSNEPSKPIVYFSNLLKYVNDNIKEYNPNELEVFFIRNFDMFAKMLSVDGRLEYFQTMVMHTLTKYSLFFMGHNDAGRSKNPLVLHYRMIFWRIFFKTFLKLTDNDYGALFAFLEKLHPSIMVTLIKFNLLADFDYKPSESFLNKIEHAISSSTEEEINSWNVDQGSLANEAFLAHFYEYLVIPSSMDSQSFRNKYYEYCEKRDKLFTTCDKDLVTDVFVKYSTKKFNSYWIAFFILRTHLMKPSNNRNMGIDNPILKFIRNEGFIGADKPIEVKLKMFERYTNNFVRVYRAYGVPLDGLIAMEFMLKAQRLGLKRYVLKWYLFAYYRLDKISSKEVWVSFHDLNIFKLICDSGLPVIEQNESLVTFSSYYAHHKEEMKKTKPDNEPKDLNDFRSKKVADENAANHNVVFDESENLLSNEISCATSAVHTGEDTLLKLNKVNEDLNKIDFGLFKSQDYLESEKEYFNVEEITLDEFLDKGSDEKDSQQLNSKEVGNSDNEFNREILSCLEIFESMVDSKFIFKKGSKHKT